MWRIGGRLAMERLLGWFPHNHREWIEFIIVAVLLWLLTVVVISELEVIPIYCRPNSGKLGRP